MPVLTWLDNSAEEQRRVTEFISYFTEGSTVDEVGVGQIRDAFSDLLFPGTSTLHTRARYLLIVPWCYQWQGKSSPADLERSLIPILREEPGSFGGRAGQRLRNLPSSAYWGALVNYGILTRDVNRFNVRRQVVRDDEAEEAVGRRIGDWNPTMPKPPVGFPAQIEGGLELTHEEATWLREAILKAFPESFLGRLVMTEQPLDADSRFAWTDSVATAVASSENQDLLRHANRFSFVADTMQQLYRLLLAEAADRRFGREEKREEFQEHWQTHLAMVGERSQELIRWDLHQFWAIILAHNPRVRTPTRRFVDEFVGLMQAGPEAVNSQAARELVERRERQLKRAKSRFENDRLLGQWDGSPRSMALSFRWGNVKQLVTDIQEGVHAGS